METNNGYWESKVQCVIADTPDNLCKMMNALYEKKFVVGTKVFPYGSGWVGFIWYKVKP